MSYALLRFDCRFRPITNNKEKYKTTSVLNSEEFTKNPNELGVLVCKTLKKFTAGQLFDVSVSRGTHMCVEPGSQTGFSTWRRP